MISFSTLTYVFLSISIMLTVYCCFSAKRALAAFILAIGLNIFPLMIFPYLGNEETRISRIPIAYLPFIGSFVSIFIANKLKIIYNRNIIFLTFLSLIYLPIQSFFLAKITNYKSFLEYYMMWIINMNTLLFVGSLVPKVEHKTLVKLIKLIVFVTITGCMVGVIRRVIALDDNANFMPLMNRNGTAFMVVLILPLLIALKQTKDVKLPIYIASIIIMFVFIVFSKSRMGFIGFVISLIIYYVEYYKKQRSYLIPVIACITIFLFTISYFLFISIGESTLARLTRTLQTANIILSGNELQQSEGDYARYQLIKYGISIIKDNFLFGTGVGLENYRYHLEKYSPIRMSKPHNFYISYLAEFGVLGFTMLLIYFYLIWKNINNIQIWAYKIAYRTIFLSVICMFALNEYITFPVLWFVFGIGYGMSLVVRKNSIVKMAGESKI